MAYMDWNILFQREASFKGQNREALNDQSPLKPKDPLKSKDGYELYNGDISQPSKSFNFLTYDHNKLLSYYYYK